MIIKERIASLKAAIATLEGIIEELEKEERRQLEIEYDLEDGEELIEGTPEEIAAILRKQFSSAPVSSVPVGKSRVSIGVSRAFRVLKDSILPDEISSTIQSNQVHEVYRVLKKYADNNNILTQDVEIDSSPSALCSALTGSSSNGRKMLKKIL